MTNINWTAEKDYGSPPPLIRSGLGNQNQGGNAMNEIKYRAIKYIRLSDADDKRDKDGRKIEKNESDSVANQRKLIDEWLKGHPEIEVVDEKIDDGVSGIIFDRKAFKEMMELIERGEVNCCVTKDLSRLGREHVEMGRYLRRIFPFYGVRFIAINDNIDTLKDSGDDLAVSVITIINDAYCRDISLKTRSTLDAKREEGDFVGACPIYGYRKSEENHNRLVIDNYAANVVSGIFRMKLDGMAAARIADALDERGVLSPHEYKKDRGLPHPKNGFADREGAKWSATQIIRILTDETYTGTLVQGKQATPNYKLKELLTKPESEWQRTPNAHEAIIPKHIFDLTQKILRLDTRTAPGGDKVYIFSGILICGCCGNRMTRYTVPSGGKKYFYYRCPTGKKGGCGAALVKESELTDCVLESVKAHVANVASLERLLAGLDADRVACELATALTEQLAENERRLDKIREFRAGLYENMVGGNLSKEEYRSLKAKYSEDAGVLIAASERLKKEIDDTISCKHERMAWIEHFREFENLSELDRRTVIHLISSIRILGKTEVEIGFNYQAEYETALALLRKEAA
jgi:DNA invertase Pin-like site-specific DNA recombinase